MSTNTYGQAPGFVTPKNDEGIVTGQGNNPQNTTNSGSDFKSKIIAACAKVKGAATGFYIDRGIGADTILMIVLALVYGGWRAAQ